LRRCMTEFSAPGVLGADGKRHISNSELSTFKECRRRWYLQYVRCLVKRREEPTGPARLGTRIHGCLANFYEGGALAFISPEDVLAEHEGWIQRDLEDFPEREDDILKEAELSRIMLEGYFPWLEEEGADEGLSVSGVERPLEYEILPGVILQGKLDVRVVREVDGARMVLDHKTVQNFTDPMRLLPLDEQVKTYLLLERLTALREGRAEERIDGAIWNMLRKVKRTATAKPPFYMRHEVFVNDHVLRDFYFRIVQEIQELLRAEKEIAEGAYPYPRPCRDCSWKCPFFGVCPILDDSTKDAEGLIKMVFEVGDPYKRYTDERGTVA